MEEEGHDSFEKNRIGKKLGLPCNNNTIHPHHPIEEKNCTKHDSKQNDVIESYTEKVIHFFERNVH